MLNDAIKRALLEQEVIDEIIEALETSANWSCEAQLILGSRAAPELKVLARDHRESKKHQQIARRSDRRTVRAAKRANIID